MPTPFRHRLRRLRRALGYVVAIGLVSLALVLAVASQLLPLVERHPEQLAQWLGQRVGRPIAFDRVETAWTRRGPLLQLHNLRLGHGDQAFAVGNAEMLVSIYAGLWPGVPLSELRLRGLDLTLERLDDGRWQVRGLPGQQGAGGDPFRSLEGLGELQVIDGALAVLAPELGVDLRIPHIDLRLQVNGDRVRAGLRAWPRNAAATAGAAATPVEAMLDFDHRQGSGKAYLGIGRTDVRQWASALALHGVTVQAGEGQAKVWARLEDKRVVGVSMDAAIESLVLTGSTIVSAGSGAGQIPLVPINRLTGRVRWQRVAGGWQLDVPVLTLDTQGRQYRMDQLALAGGEHYGLLADRIDLQPLASIALLSDRLPVSLRHWLLQARPHAALTAVELRGRRDGPMRVHAHMADVGFAAVGDAPGLDGLAADLSGDAEGFSLQLDAGQPVRFDWPSGFGVEHMVRLDGTVSGWRGEDGWQSGTSSLRIQGPDFGASVRGGLGWTGDGGRPRIDLAAAIDPTRLPVAKGFWVRHQMSDSLLEWLDEALVDGMVRDGRAVVSGDLDDWPFDRNDGRFEASARITDATVAFQPDWPVATGLELDARFIGSGFSISGEGELAGIAIPQIKAGVDHYGSGRLTVEAHGGSDVSRLIDLLRASPLEALDPETFAAISGSGQAQVGFRLALPMEEDADLSISGDVRLANATLADSRWDLSFDRVNGRVTYTQQGFRAEQLQVRHAGHPGKLSLRVGEAAVRDRRNLFEGDLEAEFGADTLLARAPELDWLAPHLDGASIWTVGVVVPEKTAADESAPAARLKLASDLVGTRLSLPAPLDKPADAALATTVETALPMGDSELRIGLGELLAMRVRQDGPRTGIRAVLGSGVVTQPAPASGLIANGHAARFDAIGWSGLAQGGKGGRGGDGVPLRRVDVQAGELRLLGAEFPDTRVLVLPEAGGVLSVQAEGPMLQGRLQVPASATAPVTGHFERVYWRPKAGAGPTTPDAATALPGTNGEDNAAAGDSTDDDIDPARIPPLSLAIDDLRIADARLGEASLATRPMAAGIEVEYFRAQAAGQKIDAHGHWTGQGAAARTRLDARLESRDFGRLMSGLGYPGRLDGGEGAMTLAAAWDGGPMQFGLVKLSGSLSGEVRDGRLLEVEPGAGRVLGLLSVAELPRRLTLDFRDFFSKGFAFNQAGGEIRFADGTASTGNLRIDGPAARINIRGKADLRGETFNQTIEVLPRSGNLLAVAGALAGGPVGAAIGAAANAVLQKPLGQIGAKTYRVSGPWKEPRVEVIHRETERPDPDRAPEPLPGSPADPPADTPPLALAG